MASAKLDYSRLLDDEFLNHHGEHGRRGRAYASMQAATRVLGAQCEPPADDEVCSASSRCVVFLAGMAMAAVVLMVVTFAVIVGHNHLHQALLAPLLPRAEAVHGHADCDHGLHVGDDGLHVRDDGLHVGEVKGEHLVAHYPPPQVPAPDLQPHAAAGIPPVEDGHDHADDVDHEHVLPGDVVYEEHHLMEHGEPEPTEHVLMLCLRDSAVRAAPKHTSTAAKDASTTAKDAPTAATAAPLATKDAPTASTAVATEPPAVAAVAAVAVNLSRHQHDAVVSAAEFLSGVMRCHLVVLGGVDAVNATTATTAARPPFPTDIYANSGCSADDVDSAADSAGSELVGTVSLPGGRSLPVVRWEARSLFAGSPLAAGWGALTQRRARAAGAAAVGLLDLAARIQLLWRFGGASVNLDSSADQVLKALSAFNRSDTNSVYLETTRATFLAAPQTCSSVVFELINAINKQISSPASAADSKEGHQHYDADDVQVFDAVLNEYCRRGPGGRGQRPRPARSAPQVDKPPVVAAAKGSAAAAPSAAPLASAASAVGSKSEAASAAFRMLRAGKPAPTSTPTPAEIHVDTTRCSHGLVAISLP